jgi:anti-anti-sigma regulatory factor
MATKTVSLNIDRERVDLQLHEAINQLDRPSGDLTLDFSSIRSIDSSTLRALEKFADIADEKSVKPVLRGVNVHLYKTLKLVKLAGRFSFDNHSEGS